MNTPEPNPSSNSHHRAQNRRQRHRKRRRRQLWRTALTVALSGGALALLLTFLPQAFSGPQPTEPSESLPELTTIHIAAAGDLNVTDQVISQAQTEDGYDFSQAFIDVAPVLSQADLTLMNFEGILAGQPYGSQYSSAPQELAQALAAMGVDVVQTANSASIRAGMLGLQSTITGLQNAGVYPLGTFYDRSDYRSTGGYTIVDVQGIRIALVAFTKGMDNMGLPAGSERCVNLLYKDYTTDYKQVDTEGITELLEQVQKDEPDLTIAMVHWGSENNEALSDSQKSIRRLMLEQGVDVVLGTHSHLVQSIEFNQEAGTLVAYSLGDFFGDATLPGTNYSLILDLEVQKNNVTGEVSLLGYSYTPIFTVKPQESPDGILRVVRIHQAMTRYDSGYLGRVTRDAYESMDYALLRLEQRIDPEQD